MSAPVLMGPPPSGGGLASSPDWDEVLADIGDRIRAERQARRWSQDELAGRSGLNRRTLSRLEDGVGTIRVLAKACWGLGVGMDWVLSPEWTFPDVRLSLAPAQVRVLEGVAGGEPLRVVAAQLGMTPEGLASLLSQAYQRLGVAHLPRGERRTAAVRVAVQHSLIAPPNRTT